MNSYERVKSALAFEAVDRVPVIPEMIQHALNVSGEKHRNFSTLGEAMAKTIISAQKRYNNDAVYVSSDNFIFAEAYGGKIAFPEDEPPQLVSHPFETALPESLPAFDLSSGRMHVILKATHILREFYQDSLFVKTNIDSAPFSMLASLRGPQNLLMDPYDEPDIVHSLLGQCTDAIIKYGLEAAKAGTHGIAFGDSVSGLLNRDMYREFALPYARKATIALKQQTGLPVFYHVCGNSSHILDLLIESGADCIELDSVVDMTEAYRLAKSKCTLQGNIDTINVMLNGTVKDVRKAANDLLDFFGRSGGFILSTACEIPRNSPSENVLEISKAASEYTYNP